MEQNLTEQMSAAIQIIDDAVKNIKEQAERDVAELLRAKATMLELATRWRLSRSTETTPRPEAGDRGESPVPFAVMVGGARAEYETSAV